MTAPDATQAAAPSASVLLRPVEAEMVRLTVADHQRAIHAANVARKQRLDLLAAEYKVPEGAKWELSDAPDGGIVLSWPLEVERTLALVPPDAP